MVAAALVEDPEIETRELLRRATAEGYDGGKSAFYALVASTRTRDALPGEFSRHDVVELTRVTRVFVTRLEFSQFMIASLLPDNGLESLARALVDHFARIGGVPLVAAFDSLRLGSAATEPLAHLALDLGIGIELPKRSRITRTIRDELVPQQLGDKDLVRRIEEYTAERNARIAEHAFAEERRRLRPLRVSPAELTLRFPITVQPGGVVQYDDRDYLVPNVASGSTGIMLVAPRQIRIVVAGTTSTFARFFPPRT